MVVQQEVIGNSEYTVFLNATRESCMKEFQEYCEKYPPAGYGTRIDHEDVDHGFLGDGYFMVAQRSLSCD
jgi:hypothetical protein